MLLTLVTFVGSAAPPAEEIEIEPEAIQAVCDQGRIEGRLIPRRGDTPRAAGASWCSVARRMPPRLHLPSTARPLAIRSSVQLRC
jgi:hypothetical protein